MKAFEFYPPESYRAGSLGGQIKTGYADGAMPEWICDECAARYVNAGGRPLNQIWGANQVPFKLDRPCGECGKVTSVVWYPMIYRKSKI
jgi:hypothetical protein